jgi:hypothetical protein
MAVPENQRLLNSWIHGENGQGSTSDYRGYPRTIGRVRVPYAAAQHLDSEAHRDLSVKAKARQGTLNDRIYFQIWHLADGLKLSVVFIEPFEFWTSGLLISATYEQVDRLLSPRGDHNPTFEKFKRHFMLPEHLNQSIIHLSILYALNGRGWSRLRKRPVVTSVRNPLSQRDKL